MLVAFSRHADALAWARQEATRHWGPVALESERFDFDQTEYYTAAMGPGLKKTFVAFETLLDPGELAAMKRQTNAWEQQYAGQANHAESRPLNLDPGYLTEAKLVLASTKDYAHRIYLADGIFAEVTLGYRDGAWRAGQWTFPDFRRDVYHAFLTQCRDYLRQRRRQPTGGL